MKTRLVSLLWALLLLAPAPRASADTEEELTVLSYHEVAERGEALVPQYAVTPTNFVRQMDWLRNHGYRFVGVRDLLAAREGRAPLPPKAVLVTFDDGYQSVYDHAWPVLKMFRIPAVINVVGGWLEEKGRVNFDGKELPRGKLLSWPELREMSESGLVEIGSHSCDLHRGIVGNPQGNLEPAATTRRYLPDEKRYEDEATYRRRVEADLERNNSLIRRHTGKAPRVIAWPYGRYNEITREIAAKLGMPIGLTLDDGANVHETPLWALRRILVESGMALWDLAREIAIRNQNLSDNDRPQKIMHVDLDYVYDADPAQQDRNLGHLLDRIEKMGVNTVYLQAFSDPDGNGSADSVYFPCRRLPMRADLFNRAAWQIRTRTQVKRLYAWMPALAWELPATDPAAHDRVETVAGDHTDRVNMGYRRLSPFSPRAREAIREIYEDLARAAPFEGILFHDDLTLSDYEDASPSALATYRAWGLPGSVEEIRKSDDLLGRWTIFKINALDDFALDLAAVVRRQQPALRVARNLYARVALNPKAEVWYSQSLDNSIARYDFTAIMAMPYMEKAPDQAAFFHDLVHAVDYRDAMKKVVFELQTVDWRNDSRLVPSEELADTIRSLYGMGVEHVGFYPDALFRDHPSPRVLKPALDAKPNAPEMR
ncbi:poly-beta-1,6-N-acetyl-D-glucosamine N-deacetylase PgaB [Anaeromyxobacter oryzae]|uniref:Poly-beta-1,6-N-acetyl-D-glucosamine N-deacetylase PgaB n=1 Tax=Anaeromyxobacter oryzae TaxID=2918170 RepID=A0ABN6N117_9BACT|nr:poly-beta-1,6-N-acetyl-D-glucosamine N-deacetylase PgaB [Anaeromyxobacter oryzae]BDG05548.1 poly-beta-1,6-N-acetyl-D-glucosamine N-deacetylase PgaB [Anaeromyxobacter oryzae]